MIEKGKAPRGATNTAKGNEDDVLLFRATPRAYSTTNQADGARKKDDVFPLDMAKFLAAADRAERRQKAAGDAALLRERDRLRELIPYGQESAKPMRTLAAELGVSDRELRATVRRQRRAGFPILSSKDARRGGYFLPLTQREAEQGAAPILSAALDGLMTYRAMLRNSPADGQTVIDVGGEVLR